MYLSKFSCIVQAHEIYGTDTDNGEVCWDLMPLITLPMT